MKIVACSNMWNNLTVNIPKKEFTNCCKMERVNLSETDLKSLNGELNSIPLIQDQRRLTLEKNQLQQICSKCVPHFPAGAYGAWNKWKDVDWTPKELSELNTRDRVRRIDIFLNSTCNMACMYCDEYYSNTWAKLKGISINESSEYKNLALDSIYSYIKKYHADGVREDSMVYNILGGEPLLNLEIIDVIENIAKLYKNPDNRVKFEITTSLCVKPKIISSLIELRKKYPEFGWIITASIDAIGKQGENIRTGLDFDLFEQNLMTLYENLENSYILIQPALNALSIRTHSELIEWMILTLGAENYHKKWEFRQNIVVNPSAMHISILPNSYKSYVDDAINVAKFLPDTNLNEFLAGLKNMIGTNRDKLTLEKSRAFYVQQGKWKGLDYFKLFPELEEILDASNS